MTNFPKWDILEREDTMRIIYNTGIGYVRFVGTHAEYDRIDVEVV